jgi:phage shock protein C
VTDRLYRSTTDRVIAGVAGGLATWLDIDPSLVRVGWVLLAIFTGGAFVLVYIVMMIVVPLPPAGWVPRARTARPAGSPGTGAVPGWQPGGPGAGPQQAGTWGQPADTSANPAPGGYPGQPAGSTGWGATPPAPAWDPASAWTPPRQRTAAIVGGIVLIALGTWFLIDQYVDIPWELVWPVVIMVLGGVLIAGAMRRRAE